MQIWLSALLAATPVPSSTPDPAETFYSPGTIGFIATFGVTAGAVLLIFDMVRRVRRVRYRAEIEAKLEAESQVSSQAETAAPATKPIAKAKPASSAKPAAKAKPERPAPPAKPKR
ncbi:MAG: hypothetical protein RLZZ590_734 [Actinomycetota bacterium]|jgi:hypothetical protein